MGWPHSAIRKLPCFVSCSKIIFKSTDRQYLFISTCGVCSLEKESNGEKKVKNFLIAKNIDFVRQKMFINCRNIYPLKFDFYLSDYNLCIEYDGELHYKSIEYFGGEKTLKQTQINDKIKTNFCLNNDIKLIRIPYWELKSINNKLNEFF